jgi:hypothetical protein
MPTHVQSQPDRIARKAAISSQIARLLAFKLDDDLRVVILFSLLGLIISFALIWLTGAEFATWTFPPD